MFWSMLLKRYKSALRSHCYQLQHYKHIYLILPGSIVKTMGKLTDTVTILKPDTRSPEVLEYTDHSKTGLVWYSNGDKPDRNSDHST